LANFKRKQLYLFLIECKLFFAAAVYSCIQVNRISRIIRWKKFI